MINMMDVERAGSCNPAEPLRLRLEVEDSITVRYLAAFDPEQREAKALEALRVGVIAIRSATPTLDTGIVEAKFKELEATLDGFAREFGADLKKNVKEYFQDETGVLPRHLEGYFASDRGRLATLLQAQIGPQSEFGKQVDPNNTQGLIQRIEQVVNAKLAAAVDEVTNEFSLDAESSALSRLRHQINGQIDSIKGENAQFFAELREHLGMQAGREAEAARGTQKGRDFEDCLYDRVAEMGRALGDLTENLTAKPGNLPRCKKGDYVCTLGGDSGAAGQNLVIEAKHEMNYTLKTAMEELKEAKENRDASVGIMVFSDQCCPPEVGGFRIVDRDIFLSVSPDSVADGSPLVFLESAYRIARATLAVEQRQHFATELDAAGIARALGAARSSCEKFAEIRRKASSIRTNAQSIEELADELRPEIEAKIREIELLIRLDAERNQRRA